MEMSLSKVQKTFSSLTQEYTHLTQNSMTEITHLARVEQHLLLPQLAAAPQIAVQLTTLQ